MKKSLNHFQSQSLNIPEASEIKGGYSFCEWYMDYNINNGTLPSQDVMGQMMALDNRFGITPDMARYGTIAWA